MAACEPGFDGAVVAPAALRPFVGRVSAYHYRGLPAGTHLGLPSPALTVVLALGPPTCVAVHAEHGDPVPYRALVGGLGTRPALIAFEGELHGIQLELTPHGCRALLGLPAGALAEQVVELDALLGPRAGELVERLRDARGWPARLALLEQALLRRARLADAPPPTLDGAWRMLVESRGAARVADVAREVGYSRHHLVGRFRREFGLGPKELGRVVRFQHSVQRLRGGSASLADTAHACGYFDQAHMARDWNAFAGCPPSRWLASDEHTFLQDARESPEASSVA